jgi:hypothetical protein
MSAYTKEETQHIVDAYVQNPTEGTVMYLAEIYDRSVKSIIGKLSREGVYQRKSYKTKAGLDPITKTELSAQIASKLGLPVDELEGLEKAPKPVLQRICEKL